MITDTEREVRQLSDAPLNALVDKFADASADGDYVFEQPRTRLPRWVKLATLGTSYRLAIRQAEAATAAQLRHRLEHHYQRDGEQQYVETGITAWPFDRIARYGSDRWAAQFTGARAMAQVTPTRQVPMYPANRAERRARGIRVPLSVLQAAAGTSASPTTDAAEHAESPTE